MKNTNKKCAARHIFYCAYYAEYYAIGGSVSKYFSSSSSVGT